MLQPETTVIGLDMEVYTSKRMEYKTV
jgi:hypothetical protein